MPPGGGTVKLSEGLLPEFDAEMKNTRKTIERVPEEKFGWKPHAKSGTMGWLASHLARLPSWAIMTIEEDSLDIAPAGGPTLQAPSLESRQAILAEFDKNVAAAREAIAGASDEHLRKTWTLFKGGEKLFGLPRIACLRGFVLNHVIHHRAQMGVYLRLNDIPVPAIYGPSADENPWENTGAAAAR